MSGQETVLVTGGSGFIGSWCVIRLLQKGYRVRTTVRSLARESAVRAAIGKEVDAEDRLSFHAAELTADAGWNAAAAGCDYMLHHRLARGHSRADEPGRCRHSGPRRYAPRRLRRARCGREARGPHLIRGGGDPARRRPRELDGRNDMDRSRRSRGQRLFALQDRGRACRLGTRPHVERRHDARHGQSFRGARPGSQPGLFPVGRARRTPVVRQGARSAAPGLQHRRRARRRRLAYRRDDRAAGGR